MTLIRTLAQLVDREFPRYGNRTAVIVPGDKDFTYLRLWDEIASLRRTMNDHGLTGGERIGLIASRGWPALVGFLAVANIGVCAPLNPGTTREELDNDIDTLGLDALVYFHSDPQTGLRPLKKGIPLIVASAGGAASASVRQTPAFLAPGWCPRRTDDVALVMKTSGSTSKPKVVELTHANVLASTLAIGKAFSLSSDDRCLNLMPLFHVHGLLSASLASLIAGSSVICAKRFDPQEAVAMIEQSGPTWLTAAPTMHLAILQYLATRDRTRVASDALRFARSSSAPLPRDVIGQLEHAYGAPLIETYGLTESSSLITSNPLPPGKRKVGSVGLAVGAELRVVDPDGRDVSLGETGEIVVRGPSVITRYGQGAVDGSSAFVDGWLRTGDAGYLDEDGYLFVTHRIKEVIKRGGNQVVPSEVDAALRQQGSVLEAVTFSLPHPTLGEDVAAAVVIEKDSHFDVDAARRELASKLSLYKVPSHIFVTDNIPKNQMGKIVRRDVARLFHDIQRTSSQIASGEIEARLQTIWHAALGTDHIGTETNLFLAGADPVRAQQVSRAVLDTFGVQVAFRDLFLAPTIRQQVRLIEARQANDQPSTESKQ